MTDSSSCKDLTAAAAAVRLVVFDVDGVLTNGQLLFDEKGQELKGFHVRDGLGIKLLQACGIRTAVITGRKSQVVVHRMQSLGMDDVMIGRPDKLPALEELCDHCALSFAQVAYIGDDIVDLPAMQVAGFSATVADAHPRVLAGADWVSSKPGGNGAVRELAELILASQNKLDLALDKYLERELT